MSENANSGIYVSESLSSGQSIPVRRDTVVAFIGSAPRGPVGIPVAIGGVDEYLKRFGVRGCDSPLLEMIRQFFANGGKSAIVIRVCSSDRRHRIMFPGPEGVLTLEAINPGPHELLRASIDYDGIAPTDINRFNLVIHRLTSRDRPIIEQQEVYRGLSIDIADTDFVGYALLESELVCIKEKLPGQRPDVTFRPGIEVGASYIYVDPDWPATDCLTDYDLIGCRTEGTGLFALDQLPSVDLVSLVPDAQEIGPVAMFAAERYCRERNAILLVDLPSDWHSVHDAIRSVGKSEFTSPNVATYFPRPIVQGVQTSSALGAFAGALVARDADAGFWGLTGKTSLDLRGCGRPVLDIDIEDQHALNRAGINALGRAGASHLELTGLVTMNRGAGCIAQWDHLQLRRIALAITGGIKRGTRWAAFQVNDTDTQKELIEQVQRYLGELFAAGVLSGPNATDAGYVICNGWADSADKKETDSESGVSFEIGFVPNGYGMQSFHFEQRPAECRIRTLQIEHAVAIAS